MTLVVSRPNGRPVGQSDDLTEEEVQRIISLPDRRTKEGLRDYAVLLALANTPMRKGELISLTVGNLVDEGEKKFLTYQGLKKRSNKPYWLKIPIAALVFEWLWRYAKAEHRGKHLKHSTPLFMTLGKHGPYIKRPLTVKSVDKLIFKYGRLAKIKKRVTPHSFRATYITQRADKDLAALRVLSGHADLKGLTPYVRAREKKVEEAAMARSYS